MGRHPDIGVQVEAVEVAWRGPDFRSGSPIVAGLVWDYDFEGGHNLVEVYMGRLRRKLIAAGAGDPFVTVRGAGYRLEPRQ